MKTEVIIVAGGKGKRMNSVIPKQFLVLRGKPILMRTIECFYHYDSSIHIILVLPQNQLDYWANLCADYKFEIPHEVVVGGAERFFSVKNGLRHIWGNSLVAVHDGVRPFVSTDTLARCFAAAEKQGTAVPYGDITESLRKIDGQSSRTVNRNLYKSIQTPQVFQSELLLKAYEQEFLPAFTDDASVVEAAGGAITLVPGNPENIKITSFFDLLVGEALLKSK